MQFIAALPMFQQPAEVVRVPNEAGATGVNTAKSRINQDLKCTPKNKTVFCGIYRTAEEAHYAAIAHKLENYWKI